MQLSDSLRPLSFLLHRPGFFVKINGKPQDPHSSTLRRTHSVQIPQVAPILARM
jgi:hypothetical protein